jgi:hypothetical protein
VPLPPRLWSNGIETPGNDSVLEATARRATGLRLTYD